MGKHEPGVSQTRHRMRPAILAEIEASPLQQLLPVACANCGVTVAHTAATSVPKLYCGYRCAKKPNNEERNNVIVAMRRDLHYSMEQIAIRMELSKQRVQQILKERGISAEQQ